ncbi:AMIN-like domain-containing (lipo)protein [Myceligenerans indicum]|uniref:AMIN-like domain-containing protein n=1 Tax=Myceligenerans indicum TaxID=2593663 RepID=A0ABS1LS77_9MICO|nr:hypothetical protein [Myceligenerans indicum]MBL0888853.1 hypothetical protein [Myceligenerans indicum]
MTQRRSFVAALVLPAVVALVAAGCTGGGQEPADASSPASSASGSDTGLPSSAAGEDDGTGDTGDGTGPSGDETGGSTGDGADDASGGDTAAPTAAAPFAADTSPDHAEPTGVGDTLLTVTGIRTGVHEGFDRVVFDLDGTGSGTPGWDVRYVPEAIDDGSGHHVDVAGDSILSVRISGTAAPTDSGVTEADRTPISPAGAEAVEEVVYRSWFEGYSSAFVGIDGAERPFRVFLLTDPVRVVLDVQH